MTTQAEHAAFPDISWAVVHPNQAKVFVYVVSCTDGKSVYVKIGQTRCLHKRLQALQTGCPFRLTLRRLFPCRCDSAEKHLHDHFHDYRLDGEWFEALDVLAAWINETDALVLKIREGFP